MPKPKYHIEWIESDTDLDAISAFTPLVVKGQMITDNKMQKVHFTGFKTGDVYQIVNHNGDLITLPGNILIQKIGVVDDDE